MNLLTDIQNQFIETLNNGPGALRPGLFSGAAERVMLGLKAHANTINHARLVALEQTFPLTRQHCGNARFNSLSRRYLETSTALSSDANQIGRHFPAFLGKAIQEPAAHDLIRIEWAWLESYHAAEAISFRLSDLQMLDTASLLTFGICVHPSAKVALITAPISSVLQDLAGQFPDSILLVRPETDVMLLPLDKIETAIFYAASKKNARLSNLLAAALEHAQDADPLGPVTRLINAGALVAQDDRKC